MQLLAALCLAGLSVIAHSAQIYLDSQGGQLIVLDSPDEVPGAFFEDDAGSALGSFFQNPLSMLVEEMMSQQLDNRRPVADADAMLQQVAASRFQNAMSDCEGMHLETMDSGVDVFSVQVRAGGEDIIEYEDGSVWTSRSVEEQQDDWNSFWMAPLADVLRFMELPFTSFTVEEVPVEDEAAATMSSPFFLPTSSEGHTVMLFGEDNTGRVATGGSAYDADAVASKYLFEQLAFAHWQQQQVQRQQAAAAGYGYDSADAGNVKGDGGDNAPDVGGYAGSPMVILILFILMAVMTLITVYRNLKTLTKSRQTVPVMFEHNGRLVQGCMFLSDFEEGAGAKGKVGTEQKPRKDAVPFKGVVVAADLV